MSGISKDELISANEMTLNNGGVTFGGNRVSGLLSYIRKIGPEWNVIERRGSATPFRFYHPNKKPRP